MLHAKPRLDPRAGASTRARPRLPNGKRLFGDGTIPAGLKLVDSKVSKTGVTINTCERAGDSDRGGDRAAPAPR